MTTATQHAKNAHDSDAAGWGARAGIVARGVVWLVVGLLAFRVGLGGGGQADRQGALGALRDQPFGAVLLVAMAIAFAAHAAFRVLETWVGHRDVDDDRKRVMKRAWSGCRVIIYGFFAVSTLLFLVSGPSSGDAAGPTAKVMSYPFGRIIVGLVGAGIVIGGLVQGVRGVRTDFTDKLRMPGGMMATVVKRAGTAGLIGRGIAYALVGAFLVQAAVRYDPNKAKSLDQALKTLAAQPFGTIMLLVTAVGLLSFAVWSFLEARYRDI